MIGKTISHYKITKKLGEGGMGEVYLADDLKLERQVAIKFLPEHLTKDKENVERFEREAKAAAALNHPNIVTIHEIAEEDEQAFIVMEYVDGDSLRTKIDSSALDSDEILDIIIQICEGLTKAHQADIVHRDIKPENILIDNDGRAKILDFGLAKLKGVSKLTKETSTLGTIHYMSPEQLQGSEVDYRADIWSLGIVFYEMLTGEVPFKGEYEQAISYAILNENIEPVIVIDKPEDLVQIIEKCLLKNPDDRYKNTDEINDNLSIFKEETSIKPTRRIHINKKRYFKIVIPVLVAVITIIIFLYVTQKAESRAPIPIAVVDFVNETGEYELNGLSGMLTTALEQSRRLSVITRSRMFDILKQLNKESVNNIDENMGREIANHAGIKVLVLASVKKFDQLYNIDLKVIDPIEDRYLFAASEKDEGKSNIPEMIDRLAEKTREGLEESEAEIQQKTTPVAELTTPDLEAYQHYFKGQEYIDKMQFERAAEEFEKAIILDSTFGLAYYRLAYTLDWENNQKTAKEQIEKAVQYIDQIPEKERYLVRAVQTIVDSGWGEDGLAILREMEHIFPDDKEMLYNIGDISYHIGNLQESKNYLEKVLKIDPMSSRALNHMTLVYKDLKDYDQMLQTAIDYAIISGDPSSYGLLAEAYIELNKLDAGIQEFEDHIERYPDRKGTILPIMVMFYFKKGENSEAERILTDYQENYPLDKKIFTSIGWTLLRQNKFKEGEMVFKTLNEKIPGDSEIIMPLGLSRIFLGDYGRAEKNLNEVHKEMPNDPVINNGLGLANIGLKKYDVAEIYFQNNREFNPTFIYSDYSYALIKVLKGQDILAEKLLLEAFQSNAANPLILQLLGYLYERKNQFTEAENFARKAMDIEPDFASDNLMSWILVRGEKDIDGGMQLAKKALNSRPEYDLISNDLLPFRALPEYTIGLGYLKKGKYKQAIGYLEKAHELLPERDDIIADLDKAEKKQTAEKQ